MLRNSSAAAGLLVSVATLAILSATVLLSAQAPMPAPGVTLALRSQYRLTRVGINGMVIGQAGSVVLIQEDGLVAIPAAFGKYWYNTWKKEGRIKPNTLQH